MVRSILGGFIELGGIDAGIISEIYEINSGNKQVLIENMEEIVKIMNDALEILKKESEK